MHINTGYGVIISVTTLILIALSSTLITTLSMSTANNIYTAILAQATEDENATLIILPSIGGTTDISPRTYNITAGDEITLTAKPSEGFFFRYWVISGHMQDHDKAITSDTNVATVNPITVTGIQGNIYRLQAVFTNNADLTLEDLPKGITLTEVTETISFLVIIALFEAVILGILYARRNRKMH